MVNRIFEKIDKLKDDEDNYGELKNIEEGLEKRLEDFLNTKIKTFRTWEQKFQNLILQIKQVGRISS